MTEIDPREFVAVEGVVTPIQFFGNDNATVQGNSEGIDFWVACRVKIPWSLDTPTQAEADRLVEHLSRLLGSVSAVTPALSFGFGVMIGEDAE